MTLYGHALGPVTLLVSRDRMALFAAMGPLGTVPHSAAIAARLDVARLASEARADGVPLMLMDLGDSTHPDDLPALMASLRACGVPVVASTHSPLVVGLVDAVDVFVLRDGTAHRLSEHPRRRALESLTAGEFWLAVGDDWPAP